MIEPLGHDTDVSYPCVLDILCDDHKSRVRVNVTDEIEARIIIALIQVCGLPYLQSANRRGS